MMGAVFVYFVISTSMSLMITDCFEIIDLNVCFEIINWAKQIIRFLIWPNFTNLMPCSRLKTKVKWAILSRTKTLQFYMFGEGCVCGIIVPEIDIYDWWLKHILCLGRAQYKYFNIKHSTCQVSLSKRSDLLNIEYSKIDWVLWFFINNAFI